MHSEPQSLKPEEETESESSLSYHPGPGTEDLGALKINISGAAFRPAHITQPGGVDFFINHEYGYVSGHNEGGGYVVAPVQGLPESGYVLNFSAWLYSDGPEIVVFLMKSEQVDGERPRRSLSYLY